jgi:hypothetical protein
MSVTKLLFCTVFGLIFRRDLGILFRNAVVVWSGRAWMRLQTQPKQIQSVLMFHGTVCPIHYQNGLFLMQMLCVWCETIQEEPRCYHTACMALRIRLKKFV